MAIHFLYRRRDFILALAAAAAAWPLAARAQQRERVRRIAWLGAGRADEPSPYLESLRAGLGELGWSEGRNLTIGRFWATGLDNMEAVGRELLASDPEVIVAQEFTVLGLRSLKTTKPVVFGFSGDPLDVQLVQSWARPGGNFTGMSYLAIELVGKRIELLKEWLPQTRRIAAYNLCAADQGLLEGLALGAQAKSARETQGKCGDKKDERACKREQNAFGPDSVVRRTRRFPAGHDS